MTLHFSLPDIKLIDDNIPIQILSDDTTDFKYGKVPTKRTIRELLQYGIINLDKPPRPTSHEVVSIVKKILSIPKAGHSGTLDPQVTGVLPVALDKATRILDTLLLAGKEYICNMRLHSDVEEDVIRNIIDDYTGHIYQRPPLRSSVKRVLRIRTVYESEIIEIRDREVLFRVNCQAGTYIRKYTHDIGQSLGGGAHMKELRRIRSGPFTEDVFSASLQALYDAYMWFKEENDEIPLRNIILPMEYGVTHVPKIFMKDNAVDSVCHGAPIAIPGISKYTKNFEEGNIVGIFSLKNELIALGETQLKSEEIEKMSHGLVARVKRVLMPIGTYPSMKKK